MKTKTAFPISVLGLALTLVLGIQLSKAQNTPAGISQNDPILSGSTLKSEDIVVKTDTVFVGEITQLGLPNTKSAGQAAYHGVRVSVLKVLRGSVEPQILVRINVAHRVDVHEQPPNVGSTYIFFAHKNTEEGWDNYTVLKLLPATDDHIAKVKALIAAAPASK